MNKKLLILFQICALFLLLLLVNTIKRYSIMKHDIHTSRMPLEYSYNIDNIVNFNSVIPASKFEKANLVISDNAVDIILDGNFAIVDLSEQRDYLFSQGKSYQWYKVSTGGWLNTDYDSNSYPGVWRIVEERTEGLEPIYGSCLLLLDRYKDGYWINTSRALHGTDTPEILGLPMSLGCTYHQNVDIETVCSVLDVGDYVIYID